ncbi:MAG: iron ABC transporter permease [Pseudomonadota bacterium]
MRLTRSRLLLYWVGGMVLALTTLAILPLLGVVADAGGGRAVRWLDIRGVLASPASDEGRIFFLSRFPRALAGAIAGAGLAAAGAVFQALLRNPLAEPYTLGVSSSASLGAVLAIRLGLGESLGSAAIAASSFVGAGVAAIVVWRLARVGASLPSATLLLAGVSLTFICSAASMLVQYTASFSESYRIVRWMMGGLEWIPYRELLQSGAVVAFGLLALLGMGRHFNALAAGHEAAASVGVDAHRLSLVAFAAASLIVGAVVALAGPIGFVGLIVPHAVRALVGPDHRVLLPASVFAGAAMVVICDTAARLVISPAQLPVGIVTALLGGPFFLFLLVREKARSSIFMGR